MSLNDFSSAQLLRKAAIMILLAKDGIKFGDRTTEMREQAVNAAMVVSLLADTIDHE